MIEPVKKKLLSSVPVGDITIRYQIDEENRVGFSLVPTSLADQAVIDDHRRIDPLVQVKVAGDAYSTGYANGRSCRNSATVRHGLVFESQKIEAEGENPVITTYLRDPRGICATHRITAAGKILICQVEIENRGEKEILLETLESFSISDITPFRADDAKDLLKIYKMRAEWANEGKLLVQTPEDLLLVPTDKQFSVLSDRFFNLGTKPLDGCVPFLAVSDEESGVIWGGALSHGSSWQMELYRRDNGLVMAGGIADADLGSWTKRLAPGERFSAPEAYVSVCQGDLDDLCHRFVRYYEDTMQIPACEEDLPIQYNEYRSSIANHSRDTILPQARAMANRGVDYFVIDAGWFKGPEGKWYEYTGDWKVNEDRFPGGIKRTVDDLKALGFKAGIWFEPETCGEKSEAFQNTASLLSRYGYPLTSGRRRFFDLFNPQVKKQHFEKIVGILKEGGFEYVKFDSNETVGRGCDGAESQGEALRVYSETIEELYRTVTQEIPGIVIENCSAGAARAVHAFTGISAVTSFSDAFSQTNNPIVAASLHRLLPPRQSLVWCVVEPEFDEKRLRFSLASATLGRMCISGKIDRLNEKQNKIVDEAIAFYQDAVPTIRRGKSRKITPDISNTMAPKGYQVMIRQGDEGDLLITLHTFENAPKDISIPLPKKDLSIKKCFAQDHLCARIGENTLSLEGLSDFEGAAFLLQEKKA